MQFPTKEQPNPDLATIEWQFVWKKINGAGKLTAKPTLFQKKRNEFSK